MIQSSIADRDGTWPAFLVSTLSLDLPLPSRFKMTNLIVQSRQSIGFFVIWSILVVVCRSGNIVDDAAFVQRPTSAIGKDDDPPRYLPYTVLNLYNSSNIARNV